MKKTLSKIFGEENLLPNHPGRLGPANSWGEEKSRPSLSFFCFVNTQGIGGKGVRRSQPDGLLRTGASMLPLF